MDKVQFPGIAENGTIFAPYNTVAEGAAAVPAAGGKLLIVKGSYNEPQVINKKIEVIAPSGSSYYWTMIL